MKPARLIPFVIIGSIIGYGLWVDHQRAVKDSRITGFFESQPTNVATRLTGRVAQILVKEGDTVKKDQPLIRFEADASLKDSASKIAQAAQAEAALAEAEKGPRAEEIQRQEGVVAEARASYERLVHGSLPEEIEAAKQAYEESKAAYSKALAGPRPEEVASARASAQAAQQRLRASQRGPTLEERAADKARLDQARAAEELALKSLQRQRDLFAQGAVARQNLDQSQSDYDVAVARSQEQQQVYDRAMRGTPAEELGEARASAREAKAQADLVLAGTRKEDIAAAKAAMEHARQNLLLVERGSRKEDIAAAKARLNQAEAQLLELRHGSRPEDIAQAQATAHSARLAADSARSNIAEAVVRSPFDGVVERVLVADGDLLNPGSSAITLSNPNDIWIRVYVPEEQLAKIKVGDPVDLMLDGVDQTVAAVVESVATQGEFTPANLQTPEERAKQVFAVRIRLKDPDPRVKAGMAASVKRMGDWP